MNIQGWHNVMRLNYIIITFHFRIWLISNGILFLRYQSFPDEKRIEGVSPKTNTLYLQNLRVLFVLRS